MGQLPTLAITIGDPAGIGPEISVAAVSSPAVRAGSRCVLYGDLAIVQRAVGVLGLDVAVRAISDPAQVGDDPSVVDVLDLGVVADADEIAFGKVQAQAGRAAVAAIERAVADAVAGRVAGVVTAPINKEAVWAAEVDFLGHTELLADLTHAGPTDTMFVVGDLCVFFATRHLSLAQAVAAIKADLIEGSIRRALTALSVFGRVRPRLAVAALNPHGGEGGHFGREEIDEIAPAIARVNADLAAPGTLGRAEVADARAAQPSLPEGATVVGPIPADSVFHLGIQGAYDGIVSLYHDQGHIATKTYDFAGTVSVTVGLPILRTSVDHGTAFDIAGTGQASPATMVSAIDAAIRFSAANERIAQAYPSRTR